MPSHWTYDEFEPNDDLCQGDILDRSHELTQLLDEVHPHFNDPKYVAFIVVTHTCDLVTRHGGRCKVHYVTLAVIRALSEVFPSLLQEFCATEVSGVYDADLKGKATELLQRILNQNEQALGLLYLHPDVDAGIVVPSVALLRIKFSFRADHYDVLKASRVGRLAPLFSSKLGWLAGNLYSRVATPDWSDHAGGADVQRQTIEQVMPPAEHWISAKLLRTAKRKGVDLTTVTVANARTALAAHVPVDPRTVVLERVRETAIKLFPADPDDKVRKLVERLKSDTAFQDAFKQVR